MRVLVVGGGGREHALAWKLSQSPRLGRLFCAPGNAGIAEVADCVPIGADQIADLVSFARREAIDLVVIGPEAPLAAGLVDALHEAGRCAFGPTAAAARIESDKAFARELMHRAGVPTPRFAVFREVRAALAYLDRLEAAGTTSVVVKASGLAAGKGAIVCETIPAAQDAVRKIMVERAFGAAGDTLLIEERLVGEEASLLALCGGETITPLIPAQDYKRAFDDDRGPNTGGMGSYAPAPVITPSAFEAALETIFRPTLEALSAVGAPYTGCLYGGVMVTDRGLMTIEFNCRFGDPEAQAVLPLLESDLLDLMEATVRNSERVPNGKRDKASRTAEERLAEIPVAWKPRKAVCVVIASAGYPDRGSMGLAIEGLQDAARDPDVLLFHAGTALQDGKVVTRGGRVLGVTGLGDTFAAARAAAYRAASRIHFDGAWFRRDIAARITE